MPDLLLLITMCVVCGGIGLPVARLLPDSRFAWRSLLAPVFGFAVLAVVTPVAYRWGVSVPTVFGAAVATAIGFASQARPTLRALKALNSVERRLAVLAAATVVAGTLVMIAPRWVGGDQFAVFQGNHWDTYAYLESAVIYSREPYEVVSTVTDAQVAGNPLYDLAQLSLTNRPSVQLLYGVFSRILPSEAYRLYYAYLVGCLTQLILVGLFLVRNLLPSASPVVWSAAALVFPLGFWGQYVFDINAWSQTASAALLLLMAGLLLNLAVVPFRHPPLKGGLRLAGAIAVSVAGSAYLYPEGFIFYATALAPIAATILIVRAVRERRGILAPLVPFVGVAGLGLVLFYQPLFTFVVAQVTNFSSPRVNWWIIFQVFFLGRDGSEGGRLEIAADFVAGLFGLYFATPGSTATGMAAAGWRLMLVAAVGAVLVALGLLVAGRTRLSGARAFEPERRRLLVAWISLCVLLLAPAAYLALDGNYWPAGKSVSYAAPVFMMLLALPVAYGFENPALRPLRWIAVGFVAFQLWSGVARIGAATHPAGIHYPPPYPAIQDGALKTKIGWNLRGLEPVLTPAMRVLIKPMDPWMEHHLMVFLWSRHVPFARVSEVTTQFGSLKRLGAVPPPWQPDVEITLEDALVLHFRDGRPDVRVPTGRGGQ